LQFPEIIVTLKGNVFIIVAFTLNIFPT